MTGLNFRTFSTFCGPLYLALWSKPCADRTSSHNTLNSPRTSGNLTLICQNYYKWLMPGAWVARDRCVETMKKWRKTSSEDNLNGNAMIPQRWEYFSKMTGLSEHVVACSDLGIFWGWAVSVFLLCTQLLKRKSPNINLQNEFKLYPSNILAFLADDSWPTTSVKGSWGGPRLFYWHLHLLAGGQNRLSMFQSSANQPLLQSSYVENITSLCCCLHYPQARTGRGPDQRLCHPQGQDDLNVQLHGPIWISKIGT